MTVCNMTIEGGARAGLIAPDEKTYAYFEGPAARPQGQGSGKWRSTTGKRCYSDDDAHWDKVVTLKGEEICRLLVTWGTSPEDVLPDHRPRCRTRPSFAGGQGRMRRRCAARSTTWASRPGKRRSTRSKIDTRLHRLLHQWPHRGPARRRRDRRKGDQGGPQGRFVGKRAMVVPGSGLVRAQAEEEGLADIFKEAGFEWRLAGCSMCLAMNPDQLSSGRTLRGDIEPQLRGPSGPRRAHPPDEPRHGGRGGGDRSAD